MKIPLSIFEDIKSGKIIFFIGSGVSMSTGSFNGFPNSTELARRISQKFLGDIPEENESLTEIAQKVVWKFDGRQQLDSYLLDLFNNPQIHPLPSHLLLPKLNCSIITTNYDKLIEEAYRLNNKRISVVVEDKDLININPYSNMLIKTHGCISNIEKCVLLEEDYYNWMNNSTEIKNLMRSWFLMNQIIFVGYSLKDINFRQLLIELRRKFGKGLRNCFFVSPEIDKDSYNYKYLKHVMGVQFLQMDSTSFFQQLLKETDHTIVKYSDSDLKNEYFESPIQHSISFQDFASLKIFKRLKNNSAGRLELDQVIMTKIFMLFENEKNIYSSTSQDETIDGMVFIPKGEFIMGGSRLGNDIIRIENIEYDYFIDECLVTNKEYRSFVKWLVDNPSNNDYFHPDEPPGKNHSPYDDFSGVDAKEIIVAGLPADYFTNELYNDYPVVNVDWWDAYSYALWSGKRLPTEKEWEKAARGIDGRKYSYGNDFDVKKCNVSESGIFHTTEVRNFEEGKSPYGVYDMCGNAWEWCMDLFENSSNLRNATRVLKGGSCTRNKEKSIAAFRNGRNPEERWISRGFRCVKDKK